ncbi:MAG TPA: hypothetical protein VEV84_14460 [Pyrinomonadaceae bacterium]|nr:hypothetical protein [Pyrinomonadaceae bacterium]
MFKLSGLLLTGFLVALSALLFPVAAQSRGTGSISGKVTLGDKPAKGIPVIATLPGSAAMQRPSSVTASTDEEGRYRITGLAAGRYSVAPYQPTNVLPGRTQWDPGSKSVTLGENESASDVNFALSLGGVITGRIVGPDGRPLIEQRVTIESPDKKSTLGGIFGGTMYRTDDRGIYRIYGLAAGKYLVSVGDEKSGDNIVVGLNNSGYFQKTFYPGTTERSEAQVVELTEGSVETGIDIAVGPRERTYSISGRMIDQATGKPVADVPVAYGILKPGETSSGGFGSSAKSDTLGQFKLNSLKPGRYLVFAGAFSDEPNKWTSDSAQVEITDTDVTGVEIRLKTGTSLDGVVAVDGVPDPSTLKKVAQLRIEVWSETSGTAQTPTFRMAQVGPDNTFHIDGLSAGKFRVFLLPLPGGDQVFSVRSVEQDGAASTDSSIEIGQGVDNVNARIVLESGTGTIKGEINITGGELPPGLRIFGSALRDGQDANQTRPVSIDSRGRFVVEHLPPGDYQISVGVYPMDPGTRPPEPIPHARQTVTVTSGGEAHVTLTLDLSPPKPGGTPR